MKNLINAFRYVQYAITAVALSVLAYYVIDGINALYTITHTPKAIIWLVFIVICAIAFISICWSVFIASIIEDQQQKKSFKEMAEHLAIYEGATDRTPQLEIKMKRKGKATIEDWHNLNKFTNKPSKNGKHTVTVKSTEEGN